MSRQGLIVSGALIMGLGVVVTAASYSSASDSGGGRYVIAYGAIAAGLFRMVRGLAASDDEPYRGSSRSRDDAPLPQDKLSAPIAQIAGSDCIHCKKKIVSRLDGTMCKSCDEPVHFDCRDEHKAGAHAAA